MTHDEWYSRYMELYKRNLKPKTRESYNRLQELMRPTLGTLALAAVSPDDVQCALIRVEDAAGSRQAQLAYTLLRAVYARAKRSKHIDTNPVDAIDKPQHHALKGRAIKGEDWRQLEPLIRDDVAFALAAYGGLRRGEILGLQRGDIDFDAGFIRIRRQLVRVKGQLIEQTPKSDAGRRDVPIRAELLPALRAACRLLHPRARIVPVAPETLNHRWRRLQVGEGITEPYRLHDLRHTCATQLIAKGCGLNIVQYILGHSSFKLTSDTYTHIDGYDAADALQKVASLVR